MALVMCVVHNANKIHIYVQYGLPMLLETILRLTLNLTFSSHNEHKNDMLKLRTDFTG